MVDKFLIKNPIVTEKATAASAFGKYIFLVAKHATTPEIKKAIKAIYNVDTVNVNIINTKPKAKDQGSMKGLKSGYKKAIVTLKKGQKLDILPQ